MTDNATPMPGTALPWKPRMAPTRLSVHAPEARQFGQPNHRGATVCFMTAKEDSAQRHIAEQDAAYIVWACNNAPALLSALEDFCQAAEYWAGCDEGCSPDVASSEIMSSGGAWPAQAYDAARTAITNAGGRNG